MLYVFQLVVFICTAKYLLRISCDHALSKATSLRGERMSPYTFY